MELGLVEGLGGRRGKRARETGTMKERKEQEVMGRVLEKEKAMEWVLEKVKEMGLAPVMVLGSLMEMAGLSSSPPGWLQQQPKQLRRLALAR